MSRSAQIFIVVLFTLLMRRHVVDAVIYSAPSQNVTLPLSQTDPAVFTCTGQGGHLSFLTWIINGTIVEDWMIFEAENNDIDLHQFSPTSNGSITITIDIRISIQRNETRLSCHNIILNTPDTSPTITITVAGPPQTPSATLHIVNATHIKVQWDKPFALPGFDVENYTLTILNTSLERNTSTLTTEIIDASTIKDYPVMHYISNGGTIPQNCIYLNFTLTATNDAGTSGEGFVSGGFAIASPPVSADSILSSVTFSADNLVPMLHVNFTFPTVCDYQEASYSIVVRDRNGAIVDQTNELTYDKKGSDLIEVDLTRGMQRNREYTGTLNITTVAASAITNFSFATRIDIPTPPMSGIIVNNSGKDSKMTIITSAIAVGLLIILMALITVLLVVFIARRRKLKQQNIAHQREIETVEAVQRATKSMVPNPIYSGSPVYEEIVDAKMLKSLKRKEKEAEALAEALVRDEGYVQISPEATVKVMSAFPVPGESKLVDDKYATIPEDPYTIMNPAGTPFNQMRSPTSDSETPSTQAPQNVIGVLSDQHQREVTTTTTRFNGHFTGRVPHSSFNNETEERYVMGIF